MDRVEISRELSAVDAQYNEAQGVMESIIERETAIHNAEVAKQQGNALSKAAEEMGKMLEIYHRIASGGQVPPEDEQRLMEYSHELYMAAKARPCCKRETARSTTPSLRTGRKKTAKKRPPARSRARRRSPSPAEVGTPVSTSLVVMAYTAPPFSFLGQQKKGHKTALYRFCAPLSYLRDSLRFGRLHLRWSGAAAQPFRSVVRNRSFCLGASAFPFGIA